MGALDRPLAGEQPGTAPPLPDLHDARRLGRWGRDPDVLPARHHGIRCRFGGCGQGSSGRSGGHRLPLRRRPGGSGRFACSGLRSGPTTPPPRCDFADRRGGSFGAKAIPTNNSAWPRWIARGNRTMGESPPRRVTGWKVIASRVSWLILAGMVAFVVVTR